MMRNRAAVVILCTLAAAWAGCASTRPEFYTLSPSAKPAAAAAGYSVAVGPVSVPEVVDRSPIVVRTGPNQVVLDEFNRWGSPLKSEIARVVAGNLSAMLGTPYVSVFGEPTASGARYRVLIDVMSFDSAPGESAKLDAVWAVRTAKDGTSRAGRTTASEAVQDKSYVSLAAAHSRALAKMSSDIAGAIQALERGGPPKEGNQ